MPPEFPVLFQIAKSKFLHFSEHHRVIELYRRQLEAPRPHPPEVGDVYCISRTKASNESVSNSSFLILSSGNGSKITLRAQRFQSLQEFFQRFTDFLLANIQSMPGEYFIHWFEKGIVETSHSIAVGFAVTYVRIN